MVYGQISCTALNLLSNFFGMHPAWYFNTSDEWNYSCITLVYTKTRLSWCTIFMSLIVPRTGSQYLSLSMSLSLSLCLYMHIYIFIFPTITASIYYMLYKRSICYWILTISTLLLCTIYFTGWTTLEICIYNICKPTAATTSVSILRYPISYPCSILGVFSMPLKSQTNRDRWSDREYIAIFTTKSFWRASGTR